MTKLKQFKDIAFVVSMLAAVKRGENHEVYRSGSTGFQAERLEDTVIEIGEIAQLVVRDTSTPAARAKDDAENAKTIHKFLPRLTREQATNPKMWTYLTHEMFKEYCLARWPLGNKENAADFIFERYFYDSSKRIAHNAVARLWWAAELTYAPWEKYEELEHLRNGDPYIYTKILFSLQDIHTSLVERDLFSAPILFFVVLDYLKKYPDKITKDFVQKLTKELNLVSGYKKLNTLNVEEVESLLENTAAYVGMEQ